MFFAYCRIVATDIHFIACMRYRRGHPVSLFGPSGADQQEAQDGCQNGQLWLGVPLWESREMLCSEIVIRRSQAAGRKPMPHIPAKYSPHCSQRATKGSLHRGAGRQRRSERLKDDPLRWPRSGRKPPLRRGGGPLAVEGFSPYEPRVTRSDVVSLSLSRPNAASESEAACGRRTAVGAKKRGPQASFFI